MFILLSIIINICAYTMLAAHFSLLTILIAALTTALLHIAVKDAKTLKH